RENYEENNHQAGNQKAVDDFCSPPPGNALGLNASEIAGGADDVTAGIANEEELALIVDLLKEIFGDGLQLVDVAGEVFGGIDGEHAVFVDSGDALLKREKGELGGIGAASGDEGAGIFLGFGGRELDEAWGFVEGEIAVGKEAEDFCADAGFGAAGVV